MKLAFAVAAALGLGSIVLADASHASVRKPTNIPAQSLGTALKDLAASRDLQILFFADLVKNLQTSGAVGDITTDEALTRMLSGTGTTYKFLDDNTVTILKASDAGAQPSAGRRKRSTAANESTSSNNAGEAANQNYGDNCNGASGSDARTYCTWRLAQASTVGGDVEQGGSRAVALEEILVTARRREEKAQTVPISITAVSQQTLQENNVVSVADLQRLVPSLSGNTGIFRDQFNFAIRGQTSSNGRPGVVMYLNEVPIPEPYGESVAGPGLLFDLENVQVLKGPQGTLFGRNSVGGSILLQSARPKNEFGGRVQVGYGNYSNREVDAAVNLPIIDDKLLTRIAFNGAKRDGFTWLQADPAHPNGIDLDNRDYWSVRGSVTYRPTDRIENDTILTYQDYDSHGSALFLSAVNPTGGAYRFFPAQFGTLPTYVPLQQSLGIRTHIPLDTTPVSSGTTFAVSNATNIELTDDLKLRTILGYDRLETRRSNNTDATPLVLGAVFPVPRVVHYEQYTAEMQLLGKSFGERLDWIVGAFYLDNPLTSDYILQSGLVLGLPNDSLNKISSGSKALFTQETYDLSAVLPGLKLTGGLRYTWDTSTEYVIGAGVGTNCRSVPTINCSDPANKRRNHATSSALTWSAGLDYQVAPETLLYLASRGGYRAGGTNGNLAPNYDPEYVRDYELGVKSDWTLAGRPLRTNVAVYYQDYKDIQVAHAEFNGTVVTNFTDNAAGARFWGGEFETLLRLTDDLELGANASYLNMKYTKFDVGDPNDLRVRNEVLKTIADIKARSNYSPSTKYDLSARYHLPLDQRLGDVSLNVNWSWQAEFRAATAARLGEITIPAVGLLNLGANWDRIGGSPVDASFFMTNVRNKDYVIGGNAIYLGSGYNTVAYGEPRMYGVRLRYHFGAE